MHVHVYAFSPLLDLPLYIAYGVTNVRDMQGCPQPDDPFIACAADKRRWSRETESGERVGPRIVSGADLLLLEADPLADIRHTRRIAAVIFNGNLYDRAALDAISAHVQQRARSWTVACKILWRFIKNPVAY